MITDEIVNNDKYEMPISYIIKYSKPPNLEELSGYLDREGYYGRYKILKEPRHKKRGLSYRLKIYLPFSVKHYIFPHMGSLVFGSSSEIKKMERRIPKGTSNIFKEASVLGGFDSWKIALKCKMTYRETSDIIDFLHEIDMAKGLKPHKFHEKDLDEICHNIFFNR